MKKIQKLLLLFLISFLSIGCSFRTTPLDPKDQTKPDEPIIPSLPNCELDVVDEDLTFDELFDINNIIKINIDIDDKELQKLEDDYQKYSKIGAKSQIYRKANFVEIEVLVGNNNHKFKYYDVGVRMKGNTSRHSFYKNAEITSNIHLKLSFEETFDDSSLYETEELMDWTKYSKESRDYRKDRKFLGMSKIDLRYNKCLDKSYIKEYYANEMYRAFGIISSHTNFSQVTINYKGESLKYGIYLLTEPLSKTLIKRSLSNDDSFINTSSWDEEKNGTYGVEDSNYGQLYKASYGSGRPDLTSIDSSLFGVASNDGTYTPSYDLKTNNKGILDHKQLINVINTLNNGNLDDISKVVDLEYFAMFEAVNTILGGPDDIRNNYNNYALYFRRTDGLMIFIPIDLDRVLGVAVDYDPSGMAMSNVSPFDKRSVGAGCDQVNNLYNKTILKDNYVKELYINNLKTIYSSKWTNVNHFNSIYEKVKKNHSSFALSSMSNIPFSLDERYKETSPNMSFSDYIGRKVELIKSVINGEEKPSIIVGLTNFYLTGTFDNWNKTTNKYKFNSLGDGVYSYTFKVNETNFSLKIYNSDKSMWLRCENGSKLHEGGDNIIFNNMILGSSIEFIIDTKTGICRWNIK